MVIHHNSPENTKNGDTSQKMSTKGNEKKCFLLFGCLCIKESKIEEDTRRKRQCSINQREERKKRREGRNVQKTNVGTNVTTSEHKNKKSKPTKVS